MACLSWQASFGSVPFTAWPHVTLAVSLGVAALGAALRGRPGGDRGAWRAGPGVLLALATLASLLWDGARHAAGDPGRWFLTLPHGTLAICVLGALVCHFRPPAARAAAGPVDPDPRTGRAPAGGGGWASVGWTAALGGALLLFWIGLANEFLGRPNLWRGSSFYVAAGAWLPGILVVLSGASAARLGATLASLGYLLQVGLLWGLLSLPGSAAVAGSGPAAGLVLLPVPLVVLPAALAVDWIVGRYGDAGGPLAWLVLPGAVGVAALALLLAAHWPLAPIVVARMDAGLLARSWPRTGVPEAARTQFWNLDVATVPLAKGLVLATVAACVSGAAGLVLVRAVRRGLDRRRSPGVAARPWL
jgi:hypothetical protein